MQEASRYPADERWPCSPLSEGRSGDRWRILVLLCRISPFVDRVQGDTTEEDCAGQLGISVLHN